MMLKLFVERFTVSCEEVDSVSNYMMIYHILYHSLSSFPYEDWYWIICHFLVFYRSGNFHGLQTRRHHSSGGGGGHGCGVSVLHQLPHSLPLCVPCSFLTRQEGGLEHPSHQNLPLLLSWLDHQNLAPAHFVSIKVVTIMSIIYVRPTDRSKMKIQHRK